MIADVFPEVVLRTERLTLRAPHTRDVGGIVAAVTDPVTQRWLPLPATFGPEDALTFVTGTVPAVRTSGSGLMLAIEQDGALAGLIDLKRTDWRHRVTEIGYWAIPAARGRGVLTEATAALARWVLTEAAFARVTLRIAPGNVASTRVAEKAGFRFEGVARNAGIVHAGRVDLAIYSLIPADLHPVITNTVQHGHHPVNSSQHEPGQHGFCQDEGSSRQP